jgi:hypothetical protein
MSSLWKVAPVLAVLLLSSLAMAEEQPVPAPAGTDEVKPAEPAAAPAGTDEAKPAEPAAASAGTDEAKPAEPAAAPAAEKKAEDKVPDSVAMLTGGSSGGERKSPFGGTIILDNSLGIGTFVSDSSARNSYYAMLLSLRPRYYFMKNVFLDLRFDMNVELTNSYTTSTTYKRQVMPSDLLLSLKWQNAATIPVIDVQFSPFLRIGAPTSYESRFHDLYLSTALGFDLSHLFAQHFLLLYTFRFNKNWNGTKYTRLSTDVAVSRLRGAEDLGGGQIAGDTRNVEWSVYNSLMGSYIINDQWSITLQIAIQNAFSYDAAYSDNTLHSDYAKTGRGRSDKTYGVLDVSYQPWENFGFSLGISSAQPAKTADNKSFRFPFFDFVSAGNNYTTLYFDIYATY